MRAPAFWSAPGHTLASRLLTPIAAVYGAVTAARMRKTGWRAPCPVICIGNLTLGGSGKTPAAIAVARQLAEMGERPVFLTRGYGGSATTPLRLDSARHDSSLTGDEAQLLARHAPTIIAADRAAGARLAAEAGASVIVMDDGLQNPALRKDISLAVIDGGAGFGNGCVFPAGPLRAPVADQRAAVGATLLVGVGERGRKAAQELSRPPLFTASLRPDAEAARRLAGRRVLAMAGIGRPEKFVATLEACGAEVAATRFVGDHEPYSAAMLAEIAAASERDGLLVATTEKDAARIGPNAPAALAARWLVVPVTLVFDDAPALSALLAQALSAARG